MTTDALNSPSEERDSPPAKEWSLVSRIGFRFACCYWLLYCLPEPISNAIPGGHHAARPFDWLWIRISSWIAEHLFHLSGPRIVYVLTGSNDTTLDYVQDFLILAFAILATIVWSWLDRKRKEYGTLYAWLRIFVRLALSLILFGYALVKIIPTQFIPPTMPQLAESYGESSPMNLLWIFMGASMPYTIFSGLAELIPAILLLFRRTALLGAFIATGVLLNVVTLNLCYDVPVKLYSINLLLMALFLLLPDVSRLANVFLFNRAAPPADLSRPHLPKRWMRVVAKALMFTMVAYLVAKSAWGGWQLLKETDETAPPPIYGGFDVEAMEIDGMPAVVADPVNANWEQIIANDGVWMLRKTDGTRAYFLSQISPKANSVELTSVKTKAHFGFSYAWKDPQHLVLTGKLGNENVTAHLHHMDEKQYLLTSRGFHWIGEEPFVR